MGAWNFCLIRFYCVLTWTFSQRQDVSCFLNPRAAFTPVVCLLWSESVDELANSLPLVCEQKSIKTKPRECCRPSLGTRSHGFCGWRKESFFSFEICHVIQLAEFASLWAVHKAKIIVNNAFLCVTQRRRVRRCRLWKLVCSNNAEHSLQLGLIEVGSRS